MKTMVIKTDDLAAWCLGIIGGFWQWFLNIHLPTDFWSKLFEATLTAAMCGAAGWTGKAVVQIAWKSLRSYFKKSKSTNDVGQTK